MTPYEKAQAAVRLIEEAILEVLTPSKELTNAEVTLLLGLESDQNGKQKDYLAYSALGRLMRAGWVTKIKGKIDNSRYVGYLRK